jgi:hypothetical protein
MQLALTSYAHLSSTEGKEKMREMVRKVRETNR